MRSVCLAVLIAGCQLAPSEPTLAPLATVEGRVVGEEFAGRRVDVVMSWYLLTVNANLETTWESVTRSRSEDGFFRLSLDSPPPEEAFFEADDYRLAVGFLSVADSELAPEFDWADPFVTGSLPTLGGTEEFAVVYLESEILQIPEDFIWEGPALRPGYNVVSIEADPETYQVVHMLLPEGESVELDHTPEWAPSAQACVLNESELPDDVFVDDPEFPEVLPDDASCESCGFSLVVQRCFEAFDTLCSDCSVLRLNYDATLSAQWPCSPTGEPCEMGEEQCSQDILYRCVEGTLQPALDCTGGADCCGSGCVPL